MDEMIRVAILDDHQSIIDGYQFRLGQAADIEVVASALFGEDLEHMLLQHQVDVLILDIQVPTSPNNLNPYPILYAVRSFLEKYSELNILIISMHAQRTLIRSVIESGASGYMLKDDQIAIRDLASVIRLVAKGGMYLSPAANDLLRKAATGGLDQKTSPRQSQVLSLCASNPNATTKMLAIKMGVAPSTVRNLLSQLYLKLGVNTRAAAIAKARQIGMLPEDLHPSFPEEKLPGIMIQDPEQ